jgi:diguanylate cyclase (GGDEF)-like protein
MVTEKHKRTLQRLLWLTRVRWIVSVLLILIPLLLYIFQCVSLRILPFFVIAGVMVTYNLLAQLYLRRLAKDKGAVIDSPEVRTFLNVQIVADYFLLAATIFYSGGVLSPLIFFFAFHMLTACILLSPGRGYIYSGLALSITGGIGILQYYHLVPNLGLAALLQMDMSRHPMIIGVVIILLGSTLYLTNYLINNFYQISLEERQAFRELTTLFEIGKTVSSSLSLGKTLKIVLENAMEVTGAEAGSIALFREETGELVIEAAKGFSNDFLKAHCWKTRPGGMTAKIISQVEPLIINDTHNEAAFNNPLALREGIRSLIAIPLIFDEKIIGILYVDDFEPRTYSASEIRLVSILANQAAVAINNAQMHEKASWLAITDGLTEVYNHRFFHEQLSKEVKRAERYGHSLSVIMMDIDYFKKYNDRFGHKKGDQVLKIIAKLLTKHTRRSDLVSRYGGDEFVIILPETTKEKALELADRMRMKIEKSNLARIESLTDIKLTISLGIASYPNDATTAGELVDKVDEVLYQAKESGRNKACVVDKSGKGLYCTPHIDNK